jgi:hypothetical protein
MKIEDVDSNRIYIESYNNNLKLEMIYFDFKIDNN